MIRSCALRAVARYRRSGRTLQQHFQLILFQCQDKRSKGQDSGCTTGIIDSEEEVGGRTLRPISPNRKDTDTPSVQRAKSHFAAGECECLSNLDGELVCSVCAFP